MTSTLVVDGNNILARAVHAASGREMSDGDGIDTGPLVLFANMLSKHWRTVAPDRIIMSWDDGRSTYRTSTFPGYKASRGEHTGEQQAHFEMAQEFCTLLGIPQLSFSGVEADDIIAALWRRRDGDFGILSGDKDLLQLLDDEAVFQIRPGVKPEVWGRHTVIDKFGACPEDLPYLMALAGDSGDDVPGVPRVGMKTALSIFEECAGRWGEMLNHRRVEPHTDLALMSLKLVNLRQLDVNGVEMPGVYQRPGGEAMEELLRFLSLHSLEQLHSRVSDGSFWGNRIS